jgi:hypothetical protein
MFPIAILPLALLAPAAQAHSGPHVHPHGADLPLALLLATGVASAAWLILRGRP